MAPDAPARGVRRRLCGALAPALAAALLASACTVQDRYRMVRDENVRECDKALSEDQRQRCLESLPPASFDEYERLRRTIPQHAGAVKAAPTSQKRPEPANDTARSPK